MDKKITSCIWDNCAKQIIEGYVYVKMDDIIKLNIEEEDLILDDLEDKNNDVDMNTVANYLVNEGWIFERNPDTDEIWRRKSGDIHNRELIK